MRHSLIRWIAMLLSCVSLSCMSVAAWAADAPVEGQDYLLLNPAQPTNNPNKIVVTEFFSYQCPHCFAFFPVVSSWASKLPKDVVFERVPVSLGRSTWAPIAQAFYALQAMGKVDEMDRSLFTAINVQGVKLFDESSITDFVAKQGVNASEFTAAYESFGVKSSVARAEQQMRTYRVQGTPTMVVDGKYVVLSEGTKNYDDLLVRTDNLIAKARADRAHK